MGLETGQIVKATLSSREFRGLLGDTALTPLDNLLIEKKRLRWSTLAVHALGEEAPSPSDLLGLLYFIQLIRTCDDVADGRPATLDGKIAATDGRVVSQMQDTTRLKEYFLGSTVAYSGGTKVSEVLDRCLAYYTPTGQEAINSFLDQMLAHHLEDYGKGVPGEYSFEGSKAYRDGTNNPFADTLSELTGTFNKDRFRTIAHVIQLLDDGLDWAEDAKFQSLNYFVGMATDVWNERGNPEGEDVDCLKGLMGKWPVNSRKLAMAKVDAIWGTRNVHMRATRDAYRQEILDQLPFIRGTSAKIMGFLARAIF